MSTTTSKKSSLARRLGLGCLILLTLALVGGCITLRVLDKPRPQAEVGPQADATAERMMAAVDVEAWQRTGAVTWDFGGRQQHLWDRQRQLSRVRWGDHEVLLDLTTRRGVARTGGEAVEGAAADELLEAAWSHWCNDSFWLNPIAKLFDDGTERGLVDGEEGGLLVTYSSGGVTPGDAYLWQLGENDLPTAWRMWTQILPVDGVRASWDDWIDLDTGAKVATRHKTPLFELVLSDVRGAATLGELEPGDDPFAPLTALSADSD
ncbi:MAG: hypothetical protein AAGN66_10605 [Acidobacteriota bacterium]